LYICINKATNKATNKGKYRIMDMTQLQDKRSAELTKEELKAYKNKVDSFKTKIAAAEFFGISVVTLDAITLKGSGNPNTISLIREKLNA
jgi:hypothetical protein